MAKQRFFSVKNPPLTTDQPCTLCRPGQANPKSRRRHKHHVFPIGMGGSENGKKIPLCPAHHDNVHECIEARVNGTANHRHYGPRVWDLATQAIEAAALSA